MVLFRLHKKGFTNPSKVVYQPLYLCSDCLGQYLSAHFIVKLLNALPDLLFYRFLAGLLDALDFLVVFVLQVDVLLLDEVILLDELFVFLEELVVFLALLGQKGFKLPYGLMKLLDLFSELLVVRAVGLERDFFGKRKLFRAWLNGVVQEYLAFGLTRSQLSFRAHKLKSNFNSITNFKKPKIEDSFF